MIVYRQGAGANVGDVHPYLTLSLDGKKSKKLCRGGVSPPDSKGENFCSQGKRSHFEGTIPPSKRLFHHSVHGDPHDENRDITQLGLVMLSS